MKTITRDEMNSIYVNDSFLNVFTSLAGRWFDESEYEDIKDYAAPIENVLETIVPGEKFAGKLKMTKRPFGFNFIAPYEFTAPSGGKVVRDAKISITLTASGSLSWSAKHVA